MKIGETDVEVARDGLRIQMTQAGDIVLYSENQLVVFYGSNSWAYTRLGRIADKSASELSGLLGSGDVNHARQLDLSFTMVCEQKVDFFAVFCFLEYSSNVPSKRT